VCSKLGWKAMMCLFSSSSFTFFFCSQNKLFQQALCLDPLYLNFKDELDLFM